MGKIIVTGNDQRPTTTRAVNTVGRTDNTLQILDRIVSKEHARYRQPTDVLVPGPREPERLFLHGERLNEHILIDGDEITLARRA